MKRRELVRRLEELGCVLIRHGAKHDWYQNLETKVAQPVPRHAQIKDHLAKHILKLLQDRPGKSS
ncbi:MAG: type II toxin-antitoxin system HicA family toxin [Acidobacteria bacterium]|nr:type II toxin-antitoxin system HicA family toxin [Acidobacteriota bacterium]